MALSRKLILSLVNRLNSSSSYIAKQAEKDLDVLLYPDTSPARGYPKLMMYDKWKAIHEAHFNELRGSDGIVPLIETLTSGNERARVFAASRLDSIGEERAIPYLFSALSDQAAAVRQEAAGSRLLSRYSSIKSPLIGLLRTQMLLSWGRLRGRWGVYELLKRSTRSYRWHRATIGAAVCARSMPWALFAIRVCCR